MIKKINISKNSNYELYLLLFSNYNMPLNIINMDFINERFIYNSKQLIYLAEQLDFEGIILN